MPVVATLPQAWLFCRCRQEEAQPLLGRRQRADREAASGTHAGVFPAHSRVPASGVGCGGTAPVVVVRVPAPLGCSLCVSLLISPWAHHTPGTRGFGATRVRATCDLQAWREPTSS